MVTSQKHVILETLQTTFHFNFCCTSLCNMQLNFSHNATGNFAIYKHAIIYEGNDKTKAIGQRVAPNDTERLLPNYTVA
jgi:hypothetical protein